MSRNAAAIVDLIEPALLRRLDSAHQGTLLVGLCGAQGSGKSTVASGLAGRLADRGLKPALLGLDDLYLSHAARRTMGRTLHPLFVTRGVPGTHDVALGCAVLKALRSDGTVALPRFDKATDDPLPRCEWPEYKGPADVVLFEGWCVGAAPEPEPNLAFPCNMLESERDGDGLWRRHVNRLLATDYRALFTQLDMLVLLAAPSFDIVARWRSQQEEMLRAALAAAGADTSGLMEPAEIGLFVQHYERLTRHILAEMPARADLVIQLDEQRRPIACNERQ